MNDKYWNLRVRSIDNREKIDLFKLNNGRNKIALNRLKKENNKLIKLLKLKKNEGKKID